MWVCHASWALSVPPRCRAESSRGAQKRAQLGAIVDCDHLAAALVAQHKLKCTDLPSLIIIDWALDHRRFQPPAGVHLDKQPIKPIRSLLRHSDAPLREMVLSVFCMFVFIPQGENEHTRRTIRGKRKLCP